MKIVLLIFFVLASSCAQSSPSTCQAYYQILIKKDATVEFAGSDIAISELPTALEEKSNSCGNKIRVVVGAEPQDKPNENGEKLNEVLNIVGESAAVKSVGLVTAGPNN